MSELTSLSKFLSYVLRHNPESIDLQVDDNGWASVEELIRKGRRDGRKISRELIQDVMKSGSKQRFMLSEDRRYIRAGYGHSIEVDLQLRPQTPPRKLYHGTAKDHVESILERGLQPGSRNFVHLSADRSDARQVGSRHGTPVILTLRAARMHDEGFEFYQSETEPGIWLTASVPPVYIEKS